MRRVATLAAMAALAGCGGGDNGDSSVGEVSPTERGQALLVANLKIAEEHPEDGQLDSKTVKLTEDEDGVVRVIGTTPDTKASWDMTMIRSGDEPYQVQVWVRE